MLGDAVDVEIQKVDALRHQIDLVVMLPEGSELEAESEQTAETTPPELNEEDPSQEP
jgi:transcriptional accessory protein Tex/SPT6